MSGHWTMDPSTTKSHFNGAGCIDSCLSDYSQYNSDVGDRGGAINITQPPFSLGVTYFNQSLVLDTGTGLGPHPPRNTIVYSEKPWAFWKQSVSMVTVLTIAYIVVFVLGVVNNSLVVSVIYRNRQLRTVTNYFIANLALADILVCTMMPITLLSNTIYGK